MVQHKIKEISCKLDELALQKRLEIEAEHLKRIKCTKFIRIFGSFSGSVFKVNTTILNDISNEEKTNFWDVVKRFSICVNTDYVSVDSEDKLLSVDLFNSANFTLPNIFEWTKESKSEGFFIPINSDCKKLQLMIKLANKRNVFKLNSELAKLFGSYSYTKHDVIQEMYKYITEKKLNNYATSDVTCDPHLEKLLNVKQFNFNNIADILEPYFEPLSYCCIDVEIGKDEIWDIEIETDDLSQMPTLYPNVIQTVEKKIEETKGLINKINERISLLEEFCENPALFINRKIALDSEGVGVKTIFYDNLNVQSGLFELIKRKDQ